MEKPASTRIDARMKADQKHSSPGNVRAGWAGVGAGQRRLPAGVGVAGLRASDLREDRGAGDAGRASMHAPPNPLRCIPYCSVLYAIQ